MSSRVVQRKLTEIDLEGWSPPPPTASVDYVPPEVGPEIWAGSIIALVPIIWATIEFSSRIRTQQECLVCNGSGLVNLSKSGLTLSRPRKCWSCGGFLP